MIDNVLKYKFIIIVLTLVFPRLIIGQVSVFENYDFSKGGYSLLGITSESSPNSFADSLGNWYTDDTTVLNKFKKQYFPERRISKARRRRTRMSNK